MTNEISKVLEMLESKQVEFVVDGNFNIGADGLLEYLEDPMQYLANFYGVSKEDFINHRDQVRLLCSAKTRS